MSKDDQWRSFPKVPHLLQYVSNGNYYGRIKVNGKIIRESHKTGDGVRICDCSLSTFPAISGSWIINMSRDGQWQFSY